MKKITIIKPLRLLSATILLVAALMIHSTLFAEGPTCSDSTAAMTISDVLAMTKKPSKNFVFVLKILAASPDDAALELSEEIKNLLSIVSAPEFSRNKHNFASAHGSRQRSKAVLCLRLIKSLLKKEKKPSKDLLKTVNYILDQSLKSKSQSKRSGEADLQLSVKFSELWKNTKNLDTGILTATLTIKNNGPLNISSFQLKISSSKDLKFIREATDLACELNSEGYYLCNVPQALNVGASIQKTVKFSLEDAAVCDSISNANFSLQSTVSDSSLFNNTIYKSIKTLCTHRT